jgi:hypothetical protein
MPVLRCRVIILDICQEKCVLDGKYKIFLKSLNMLAVIRDGNCLNRWLTIERAGQNSHGSLSKTGNSMIISGNPATRAAILRVEQVGTMLNTASTSTSEYYSITHSSTIPATPQTNKQTNKQILVVFKTVACERNAPREATDVRRLLQRLF